MGKNWLGSVNREIKRLGKKAGVHLRKNHVLETISEFPLTDGVHSCFPHT